VKKEDDARAIIKWLESPEGRCWSRSVHTQSAYAVKWFSLKADVEGGEGGYEDELLDVIYIDLGRYDDAGRRFTRKPRVGCSSYYQSKGSLTSLVSPSASIRLAILALPASAVSDPLTWLQFNPHTGHGFFCFPAEP
jgi:hypothetical protein